MTDVKDTRKKNISATTVIRIPVWAGLFGFIAIAVIYFVLLNTGTKDRDLYRKVVLTSTQRSVDAAAFQTLSARNLQSTATELAKATKTPTPAPTIKPSETAIPTKPIELKIGSTQISPIDNMTMVFVPAGSFMMGDEKGGVQNRPVHEVYLSDFWIDQTEISNGMYAKCVAAGKCIEPVSKISTTVRNYYGNPDYDNYPVILISWLQANDYCNWAGRQLPSEAQWEKAARGDDGRLYPWGDIMENTRGNFDMVKDDFVIVNGFQAGASPYGALQMAGNVYEWVADWYEKSYYQIQRKWVDPTGPMQGSRRVVRGGLLTLDYYKVHKEDQHQWWELSYTKKYFSVPVNFLSGNRMSFTPNSVDALIGFRCAATSP